MLERITLTDFLSFGPGPQTVELGPLNVLIGPNGSGKSNLVEALALLRAAPRDLPAPIRAGGGVDDWLWRGESTALNKASIEVVFAPAEVNLALRPIRYRLQFGSDSGRFVVRDERIETVTGDPQRVYFGYDEGRPMLDMAGVRRELRSALDVTQSVLQQRSDPDSYPEVTRVGALLKDIALYRSWSFGPNAPIRRPCGVDVPTHLLEEDLSNLPARIATLKRDPRKKRAFIERLSEVSESFTDVEVVPEGGGLRLYLTEGDRNVPAHRLSDGTLRYLALLAILIDPGPAKLVVIEEPELGLHPDVLPGLRDLLVEASQRVQLIVTTHSTQLVDGLTEHASSVVICEKDGPTSKMTRLDQAEIDRWREFGSLGTLWMSGQLGGTRW